MKTAQILRRTSTVALATFAALSVTGVGTALADPSAETATTPTTPAAELTLEQGDFPDGYFVIPAPAATIGQEVGDLGALFKAAKVTPEECKNVGPLAKVAEQFGAVQLVAAVDKDSNKTLTESLVAQSADVPALAEVALDKCSEVQVEVDDPRGGTINATVRTTSGSVPSEAGDNAAVFAIDITGTRAKGDDVFPIHQKLLAGFASLRGYTVGVTAQQLGADPDEGQFDSILGKSVEKIQGAQ